MNFLSVLGRSFQLGFIFVIHKHIYERRTTPSGKFLERKFGASSATNRADILDPALMCCGRLDCKIEFPHPTKEARACILQIHSRKMNVLPYVNFEELAWSTYDFNGAQLKAVCVEASMLAICRDATEVNHEDFNEGSIQVQAKKKSSLNYYA